MLCLSHNSTVHTHPIIKMKLSTILTTAAVAMTTPTLVLSLATRPPMRVTVFGGTGYVGSAVCERLVKRGHDVTAVSRRGENPNPDSKELSQVCVYVLIVSYLCLCAL